MNAMNSSSAVGGRRKLGFKMDDMFSTVRYGKDSRKIIEGIRAAE